MRKLTVLKSGHHLVQKLEAPNSILAFLRFIQIMLIRQGLSKIKLCLQETVLVFLKLKIKTTQLTIIELVCRFS